MPDSVLIRLANEEVIYLLRALNIPAFPGLSTSAWEAVPDSVKAYVMTMADHTLRARQLVRWQGDDNRLIDPLLSATLRDCMHQQFTLYTDILDTATRQRAERLYIFGQETIVEQWEVEPQVQQYLVMPTQAEFATRLITLLSGNLDDPANAGPPPATSDLPSGQIDPQRWQEILAAVRTNSAADLLATSLPTETAAELHLTLQNCCRLAYLAVWPPTFDTADLPQPTRALTLVISPARSFVLWDARPSQSPLTVLPVQVEQVWEYIDRLLPEKL